MRNEIIGFLLLSTSVLAHAAALSDLAPYRAPDQVWEDLSQGLLDSSEAMDVLDLFDKPIPLTKDANFDRLLAIPGILPADIASLRILLETGRDPSEHEKYALFESFVEERVMRGRMQISLSPSLSRQTDFRKKGRGQVSAGPVQAEFEFTDDTVGTFCHNRSIQVRAKALTVEAGEFSKQLGKGILLGHASPRPLHNRPVPENLAQSIFEPLSTDPDGVVGFIRRDRFQAGMYGARILGQSGNPRIGGSWLQWDFGKRAHVGTQAQGSALGPAGGVYFTTGRTGVSGELVATMQSGPAWLLSFAAPENGPGLTLYRYPENSCFLLGNPLHRQTGNTVAAEGESLRTSVPTEQGLQLNQGYAHTTLRLRAWQCPGAPQTGLQLSGASWILLGRALRVDGSLTAEQSLTEETTILPQISLTTQLRRFDFESGLRARTKDILTVNTTGWLGTVYRLGPSHRLRGRIYSSRSNTGVNSERLWVSYETGATSRARVRSSWNFPFDEPGKGWASVRVEMAY